MSTLKLRLKNLENKLVKPVFPLIVICMDGKPSAEQQQQIQDAELEKRPVKIINIYLVDGNGCYFEAPIKQG